MKVEASTKKELFSQALKGMMHLLNSSQTKKKMEVTRNITIQATSYTTLLIDFLNESLSRCQINKESYHQLHNHKLTSTVLQGTLIGQKIAAFGHDIKAVTYHEAKVRQNKDGKWETTVIFDI